MRTEQIDKAEYTALILNPLMDELSHSFAYLHLTETRASNLACINFKQHYGYSPHLGNPNDFSTKGIEERLDIILDKDPDPKAKELYSEIVARKKTINDRSELTKAENELDALAFSLESTYVANIVINRMKKVNQLKTTSSRMLARLTNEAVHTISHLIERNFTIVNIDATTGDGASVNKDGNTISWNFNTGLESIDRILPPAIIIEVNKIDQYNENYNEKENLYISIADHQQTPFHNWTMQSDAKKYDQIFDSHDIIAITIGDKEINRNQYNQFINRLEKEDQDQSDNQHIER